MPTIHVTSFFWNFRNFLENIVESHVLSITSITSILVDEWPKWKWAISVFEERKKKKDNCFGVFVFIAFLCLFHSVFFFFRLFIFIFFFLLLLKHLHTNLQTLGATWRYDPDSSSYWSSANMDTMCSFPNRSMHTYYRSVHFTQHLKNSTSALLLFDETSNQNRSFKSYRSQSSIINVRLLLVA